jgi:hypothetical protein
MKAVHDFFSFNNLTSSAFPRPGQLFNIFGQLSCCHSFETVSFIE